MNRVILFILFYILLFCHYNSAAIAQMSMSASLGALKTTNCDPCDSSAFNSSAGAIVFVAAAWTNNRTITDVTRDGVTYTQEALLNDGCSSDWALFRGVHSGAVSSQAVSFNMNTTTSTVIIMPFEVTGIDTGGTNGSDGVIQSDIQCATASAPQTISTTLAAFADSANRPAAIAILQRQETADDLLVESGYTDVEEVDITDWTGGLSWHESTTDTSPSFTGQNYTGSRNMMVVGFEMKEAAGASANCTLMLMGVGPC